MYRRLGIVVARWWPALLVGWILVLLGLRAVAPPWESVIDTGQFSFLPADAPSRTAEQLFRRAFPDDLLESSVVIVVRRESSDAGLFPQDRDFIEQVLKPRLIEIARAEGGLAFPEEDPEFYEQAAETTASQADQQRRSRIARIRTFTDSRIGRLLESEDHKASLVIVDLTTDFMDRSNAETIAKIERLIAPDGPLRRERLVPLGLDLAISGTATVGRDMIRAARESASATELWTVVLVVILLLVIYRTPLLAAIPLVTVYLASEISLHLLALLAEAGLVRLFSGVEIYVRVLSYGAGVDYCLFLISRYREELDEGLEFGEAVAVALERTGAALTASAGTVISGIGMMVFARFGKFQQAGIGISLSLMIVLLAALTFSPTFLRLTRRWAFWPSVASERLTATAGWLSAASPLGRLLNSNLFDSLWRVVAHRLRRRPGTILLVAVILMAPFAAVGIGFYRHLSYGLLSELPVDSPSRRGAQAIQQHFPAGTIGPVTMLLHNEAVDFRLPEYKEAVGELTERLTRPDAELPIADLRSVAHPLGITERAVQAERELARTSGIGRLLGRGVMKHKAVEYYVSHTPGLEGHVTRLDIILTEDPFSRNSIGHLQRLEAEVQRSLPESLRQGTTLHVLGPTASIRDLKLVTDADQVRIEILVLIAVFTILVVLLRRPAISAYLIVSVFFSYLATLGVTFAVFWALDPAGFAGLDWKVPMFLFTILIAVGEDYNIFLMSRIAEEQAATTAVAGVLHGLRKTGSIISSCGFIMAGTFCSLLAGNLLGIQQLGFALAFGVLLDTFVVRPILVPAYLVMLYGGRFGRWGRWLGAAGTPAPVGRAPQPEAVEAEVDGR